MAGVLGVPDEKFAIVAGNGDALSAGAKAALFEGGYGWASTFNHSQIPD